VTPAAPAVAPATQSDPLDMLPDGAVIAVAMSGGVDSSVAAARCVERGLRTVGVTLAMWPRDRDLIRDRGCCGVDAVTDARRVAAMLGIRHYAWNLEHRFGVDVIDDFVAEYAAGRTPNPCVRCNDRIKFGALLERARAVGATHVATGHYARIDRHDGSWTLHRGADPRKDQAYTLYRLDQARLGQAVFPVGALPSKQSVRATAARLGLPTAAKADSQELCFVDGDLAVELERRLAGRVLPGPVVDQTGRALGRHRGLPLYTVGQRSGLGISPDRPDASPLYVLELDAARNTVVAGPRESLRHHGARVERCSWVAGHPPPQGIRCGAQLRAHGEAHPATVVRADAGHLEVRFDAPRGPVVPGQALVLFDGDQVLGGGLVAGAA